MADAPVTRLYLGNLPRHATKQDVAEHFQALGQGEIQDIKLMNGFGFVEYRDANGPRDPVPGEPHQAFHSSEFMGERLVVQYARGASRPDFNDRRPPPRPRRTVHRMTIQDLPPQTSWQDLKDFARQPGLDVVYSEVSRDRNDPNLTNGFVEYETDTDLAAAVEKLDNTDFKGGPVRCIADPHAELPRGPPPGPPRERYRSRSPPYRRGYGGPPDDYYDRRAPPPRGYSPRRDDYRRRSPPPRDYYDRRGPPADPYPPRSPPGARGGGRGPPPGDDYGPPRGRYPPEDPYGGPPPRRGYPPEDPYANGHGREPYVRPLSPPRRERGGYDGYDRRGY